MGDLPYEYCIGKDYTTKSQPTSSGLWLWHDVYGIAFCNQLLYNGNILAESALVHKLIITF